MSIKYHTKEVMACDYCHKELENPKTWWRLVMRHNFTSTDFCSELCDVKYVADNFYPALYDPIEIDKANSEKFNGG